MQGIYRIASNPQIKDGQPKNYAMINNTIITQRLETMKQQEDLSGELWPENCAGSKEALIVFIGPSPGGKKEEQRRAIEHFATKPLWDEPYWEPLKWSRGFRVSFQPIVENIFDRSYEEAAKLIARFNLDWLQNPESQDVSYRYMWEGCSYVLPVIYACKPSLIIPMDEKTFGVLQMALYNDGCEILPARVGEISVTISDKKEKPRKHRSIRGYTVQRGESQFLVIKSLQHPARIYNAEYAKRVGQAIRIAAEQMGNQETINITL